MGLWVRLGHVGSGAPIDTPQDLLVAISNIDKGGGDVSMTNQSTGMTRSDILKRLHTMIDERLFGPDPWQLDRQTAEALWSSFERLGLEEQVPGQAGTRQSALGRELRADLMKVFMGFWDPPGVPEKLQEHDLIDEPTADLLFDQLCAWENDPHAILLPVVRQAYRDYFHPSRLLN